MYIVKNEEDFDQILKDNEAVFVDFYADWCGPCKMVGPIVEELSTERTDIKFVKVNVDDIPEVAERFGIMSIPTMIFFRNGEVAAQTLGFQPKEQIAKLLG
ncbi:MAG: thioredoxin [Solobacterium sp.]|nr:thioredoxin [Solobacterium sp.]MBQ9823209.1 thioredoxin [Solobacterium sp.]